jgi:hypothetical protein
MLKLLAPAGLMAIALAGVSGATACSKDCPNCPGPPAVVVVSPETVSVLPGDSVMVAALVYDGNSAHILSGFTATWSSANTGIATVDEHGMVVGIAPGTVTIGATAAGLTGSGTVQVVTTSTLSGQVAPILRTTCALAYCHRPEPSGGYIPRTNPPVPLIFLDTVPNIYAALVTNDTSLADTLIVPGDTVGELLRRLRATDSTRMPRTAAPTDPSYAESNAGNYNLIRLWITSGAPNN